jgi:ABC-type multidrug transport system ATPase subunit
METYFAAFLCYLMIILPLGSADRDGEYMIASNYAFPIREGLNFLRGGLSMEIIKNPKKMQTLVLELKKEGHTIFICTHNLDEADRLCDRIGIFSGRLLSVDAPSHLKGELYGRQIKIQLHSASPAVAEAIKALPFVKNVALLGNTLTLNVNSPEQDNPELVRTLVKSGADVQFVTESSRSLEEVYFKVMGVKQ